MTPSVAPESYGLGTIARTLVKSQTSLGHDSSVWCFDSKEQCLQAAASEGLEAHRVRSFPRVGPTILGASPAMYRAALLEGGAFDVVHQHGIWTAQSYVTRHLASRHGCPVVVAPHGALQARALQQARWKKYIASRAYESSNLHHAACLHATSAEEISDFRSYGLHNPIALITNGLPDSALEIGDSRRFRESHNIEPASRIVLFLSRIAPKKGLPLLLRAWSRLPESADNWVLVVAGADEDGHLAEVHRIAGECGVEDRLRFVGPVFGSEKRDLLAAADLFVLPSYSEGFPMVVLEALAAGVPSIVTHGSEWSDLETHKCGWWVRTTEDAIGAALRKAMSLPAGELRAMGARGRALVASSNSGASVAARTIDLYRWLRGAGRRPEFVSPS